MLPRCSSTKPQAVCELEWMFTRWYNNLWLSQTKQKEKIGQIDVHETIQKLNIAIRF